MTVLQKLFGGSRTTKSPEARFWEWFAQNEAALLRVETGEEPIRKKLTTELHRLHESLTFEFGISDTLPREFVISADGIKDAFPVVTRLVEAAPVLTRWRVIAFRQPKAGPITLNIGNRRLDSDQVFFRARPEGQKVAITVALPEYRATSAHIHDHAGYLMLDHFAGEQAVETRIGTIDFVDDSRLGEGEWRPIADLPKALGVAVAAGR